MITGTGYGYIDVPVSLYGVRDLVVVVKNGKVLVMKKCQSALVREAVKAIEKYNRHKLKIKLKINNI